MGKIIFTISYETNPEKRDDYLSLTREMKDYIAGTKGMNYSIFEQKGKKNTFAEVYVCESKEQFDMLEDESDQRSQELLTRLEEFLVNGKMKYTTLIETE